MLSYETCSYYNRYYTMKKHLYKERYLENKRRAELNEERYKEFGGEKNYIANYWKYKLSNKDNNEKKILCNNINE